MEATLWLIISLYTYNAAGETLTHRELVKPLPASQCPRELSKMWKEWDEAYGGDVGRGFIGKCSGSRPVEI